VWKIVRNLIEHRDIGSWQNPPNGYYLVMATTLNISLSPEQASWVRARKHEGGYASASDVIRELIRHENEKESAQLQQDFNQMDRADGSDDAVPVEQIVGRVKKIRSKLMKHHEGDRRS
jgi:putative addiction module CopG family antidote